jgi:DNA mismatch endonuclease (patch repair protein)
MRSNRRRDTRPELAVRRILHGAGLRFRVDFPPVGGRRTADIVFPRARVAVFIDGCYWHGCPTHAVLPKTNVDYWIPKLARNSERDRETDSALREAGWIVLRFWEHDNPTEVSDSITEAVRAIRIGFDSPRT